MSLISVTLEQRRALAGAADRGRTAAEARVLADLDEAEGMPLSAATWRRVAEAAQEDARESGVSTPAPSTVDPPTALWRPRERPSTWRPAAPRASGGFTTSLVALLLSTVPILGLVAFVVAPVGLVVCLVAIARSNEGDAHRGRALAGAVLGALALLIAGVWPLALAGGA